MLWKSGMEATDPRARLELSEERSVLDAVLKSEVAMTTVDAELTLVFMTHGISCFVVDVLRHLLNFLSINVEASCSSLMV